MTRARAAWVVTVAALALAAEPRRAHADPLALRGPLLGRGVTATLGVPEASVGGWITPALGVALDVRWPFAAIGASVGTRGTLVGRATGLGLDAFAAAGILVPTVEPSAALTGTLALRGRVRTAGFYFALGPAVPAALQPFGTVGARVPLLFEIAVAFRAGPLWIGAQAGAGATFVPGLSPSVALEAGLTVYVPIEPPPAARAPLPPSTRGSRRAYARATTASAGAGSPMPSRARTSAIGSGISDQ